MTHPLPTRDDTIFAPATGLGRAAVTVVRLSGPAAGEALDVLAGGKPEPRRLSLRRLRDPASGQLIDHALIAWLPGPLTATGEDMAEFHLHGGTAVRTAMLEALGRVQGCRPAEAGAFSRRAFFNGRIDLTEAEGIADLIAAETEAQRVQALRQLDGALGRQVAAWRETGITLLAQAEAALDFADEADVDDTQIDASLRGPATALRDTIRTALADERRGERLREGYTVVLAGAPNAGKSTLLNALSGRDVAIVSEIPGTTRDALEVRCDLGGLPVVLVDTAGLRDTQDVIEAEGVTRTRRHMRNADLILHLVPAGEAVFPLEDTGGISTLVVRTKADLGEGVLGEGNILLSAVSGVGIEALIAAIQMAAEMAMGQGDALITRERHREALTRAARHLDRVVSAPAGFPPELTAEDLRLAVRALGEVGGHVGVEDLLDRLFSGFCIGK